MSKEKDWSKYFELTKNRPPRPLLIKAMPYVTKRDVAFDLGAGALQDSIYLLSQHFSHVTAVDKHGIATERAKSLPSEKFIYVVSSLEEFDFQKESADLVNAQYSLPFVLPEHFDRVWKEIKGSLKKNALFVGQLFGDRDQWKSKLHMTFQTLDEARKLLSDLDLISFEEDEENRPTVEREIKHWHVFHFIARKVTISRY